MEKEQWINEILESSRGLTKADPGPFFFEKTIARIEKEKNNHAQNASSPLFRWAIGLTAMILIAANTITIKNYIGQDDGQQSSSSQNNSMNSEFDNSTIYNY
jgi:hypothetical protein